MGSESEVSVSKVKRTSKPKVRTGCITCKSRRIKCDEGKPECNRCRTSGRVCAGYRPADSSLVLKTLAPVPIYRSPPIDVADAFPSLRSLVLHTSPDFYFHIYKYYVSKAAFPFSASTMCNWLYQQALDHPVLAEAVLLLGALTRTASLFSRREGARELNRSIRDLFALRGRMVQSLQKILGCPSGVQSESTIILITIVFCVEAARADANAVEAHLTGLSRIIYEAGGLDSLSEPTISLVYYCDLLRGLQSSAPPVFEVSSKWINRIESKAAASKSNLTTRPSIGARFFVSPWSQDIPSPLSSILYSLCHLISRFEDIEDSDCRSLPLENDHLVLLANRLHSLPREITLTPFQDAIRLGTLCYLTVRVMRFEGNPCIENLIRTLRHNFEYSLPILSAVAPDLLFWILFISGIASQGFDSHIWCIENLRNCASQLGLRWWEDAASILEGYFFVSRLRNDPAKALWNSVVGGMTFVKQEQPML